MLLGCFQISTLDLDPKLIVLLLVGYPHGCRVSMNRGVSRHQSAGSFWIYRQHILVPTSSIRNSPPRTIISFLVLSTSPVTEQWRSHYNHCELSDWTDARMIHDFPDASERPAQHFFAILLTSIRQAHLLTRIHELYIYLKFTMSPPPKSVFNQANLELLRLRMEF